MKKAFLFVMFFAAVSVAFTTPALAKNEPAPISPEDNVDCDNGEFTPGCREETYEGNDREGNDENDFGDLFSAAFSTSSKGIKQVTEDRGATVVVTTTRYRDAYPEDNCAYVTIQVIEKKTGEVLSSSTINTCDVQIH